MKVFVVTRDWSNNGEYEDEIREWNRYMSVFQTSDEAIAYANHETSEERCREKYHDSCDYRVTEWYWNFKRILNPFVNIECVVEYGDRSDPTYGLNQIRETYHIIEEEI